MLTELSEKYYMRHKFDLQRPPAELTVQQKDIYYTGMKMYKTQCL